jgi:hypothetical protein
MLLFIWSIVLFVLFVLAVAWALYERDKRKKSDIEWDKGMDEMSSDYEQMLLSAYEQNQLLDNTAEAYFENLEETTVQSDANYAHFTDMKREYEEAIRINQGLHRTIGEVRELGRNKDEQLEMVLDKLETSLNASDAIRAAYDEVDELYGEAATELLHTTTEIERVAKEVHDWTIRGGPFDA